MGRSDYLLLYLCTVDILRLQDSDETLIKIYLTFKLIKFNSIIRIPDSI